MQQNLIRSVAIDQALEYTPLREHEDTSIDDILSARDFVDHEQDNNDNNTKLQSNSQPPTPTNTHNNIMKIVTDDKHHVFHTYKISLKKKKWVVVSLQLIPRMIQLVLIMHVEYHEWYNYYITIVINCA